MATHYSYSGSQGFTFTQNSSYKTSSSRLFGGPQPQSYGAFPPNNGIPSYGSTYSHTPRFAAPGPNHAFPESSPSPPPFSSRSFVPPVGPTVVHVQKRTSRGCKGLALWLVLVFFQVALITYRSDTLAKFVDLRLAASGASTERSALAVERKRSEQERGRMRHDRGLWEKVPEDYVPPGAYWKPLWPAYDCRGYGRREYWGMLMDIPEGWSAMEACMNTPAMIKDVIVRRPHRCAFVEGFPHIHGYWMVDWDQQECEPWHKDPRDIGCTNYRSGLTRIEAKVEGILHRREQDWRVMCESTPFTRNGINYTSPLHCEERGLGGATKIAVWDVPAESCR